MIYSKVIPNARSTAQPAQRIRFAALLTGLALAATTPAQAASISLIASDTGAQASFNAGTNWAGGAAPTSGNDYFTGAFNLQTPNDSSNYSFAGNSLTVETGGRLVYHGFKTANTITVSNLIMNGGDFFNSGTNSGSQLTLAGNISVLSAAIINTGNFDFGTLISANVSGSSTLTLAGSDGSNHTGTIRFTSASSTFNGDISVTQTSKYQLTDTGVMNFLIGADGVNNSIYGDSSQTALIQGTFVFDLSGAATDPGSSWNIVDVSTLTETFDTGFSVSGFTETNPGIWTFDSYQFSETTGLLTVAVPEPSTYAMMAGLVILALGVYRRRNR